MCINDWRLGTQITFKSRQAVVSSLITDVVPPNQQRVGIMFAMRTSSGTQKAWIDANGHEIALITDTNAYMLFTLQSHGRLPMASWEIRGTTTPLVSAVSVVEFIMPQEYLAAALESFRSEYGMALTPEPYR